MLVVLVELEESHGEEVSVTVGEAELIGAGIDDDGAKLVGVGLRNQEGQDFKGGSVVNCPVSIRLVGGRRALGSGSLLLLALFSLNQTDVENETVDQGNIPLSSLRVAEFLDQSGSQEVRRSLVLRSSIQEGVDLRLAECRVFEAVTVIIKKRRSLIDLGKLIELQRGGEGIRELDVLGEGRQDNVSELDPTGRDDVTEGLVIQQQEVREVMEEKNEDLEEAAVEEHGGLSGSLTLLGELISELDGVRQHGEVGIPSSRIGGEETSDEDAVAEKFDPSEGKSRNLRRVQTGVESVGDDTEEFNDGLRGSGFLFLLVLVSISITSCG